MLDKAYFNNGHLTAFSFLMLENEGLELEERQLVLTHINSCDECMARYISSLTEDSLIEPDRDLTGKILSAVHSEQNEKDSKKILVLQFTKLAIAVCLTMVIFFSGALGFTLGTSPKIQNDVASTQHQKVKPKFDFFESITSNFNRGFLGLADQINIGFKGDAKNGGK